MEKPKFVARLLRLSSQLNDAVVRIARKHRRSVTETIRIAIERLVADEDRRPS